MSQTTTSTHTNLLPNLLASLFTNSASPAPSNLPPGIDIVSLNHAKKVTKPWGFELWLSDGQHTPYAFKIIFIKKGTKTSLQYHNHKTEHNFLLAGTMRFHYQDPQTNKICNHLVTAGHMAAVRPPAIHRVEAITDILLCEASSTELDDVIRIEDDSNRHDGKINSEHLTN